MNNPFENYFIFDGVSSKQFGLVIDGSDSYGSAQRSVTRYNVPGRDGSLTVDDGYFVDVKFKIRGGIISSMKESLSALEDFLSAHSTSWYRLEMSHHPEEYVMAQYKNISPTITRDNFAEIEINFIRKPQRFLKLGESTILISAGDKEMLSNRTYQAAKPLIRIYCTGDGTVGVGHETITIAKGASSYIDLDCDLHVAYEGANNRGSLVTLTDWPVLKPNASTGISFSGDVTKVEITPRWFRL